MRVQPKAEAADGAPGVRRRGGAACQDPMHHSRWKVCDIEALLGHGSRAPHLLTEDLEISMGPVELETQVGEERFVFEVGLGRGDGLLPVPEDNARCDAGEWCLLGVPQDGGAATSRKELGLE